MTFAARTLFASGLMACALVGKAHAQSQPMITLYAQAKYSGPSLRLIVPADDLRVLGFANRTLSFIVQSGAWQLCTKPNLAGSCITVHTGKYPAGYHHGFAHLIVSLQPVKSPTPAK